MNNFHFHPSAATMTLTFSPGHQNWNESETVKLNGGYQDGKIEISHLNISEKSQY